MLLGVLERTNIHTIFPKSIWLYHVDLHHVHPHKVFLKTQHSLSFSIQLY